MVELMNIQEETRWFYEQRAAVVIKNLARQNINAQFVPGRAEALSVIMAMIPPGAVVARGDSLSCDQVGVLQALRDRRQNSILDPFETDSEGYFSADPAARHKMQKEAFLADIFITGTNAVTLDGKLVNIDGRGNRVAAMIFGPDKVIVVVGGNKIVKDENEALLRVRQYAAPLNAKRHALKHHQEGFKDLPCVRTGTCVDCSHGYRICHYTVIISGAMDWQKGRLNVVIVGETLGI
jgi:hypothetical protein